MTAIKYIPNLITLARLPLAVLHVVFILQGQYAHALITFTAICFSDLADGAAARALSAPTRLGELMDVVADVVYILSTLIALNIKGFAPLWFTTVVAIQFTSFAASTFLIKIDREDHIWNFDWMGRWFAVLVFVSPPAFYLDQLHPGLFKNLPVIMLILACSFAAATMIEKMIRLAKFIKSKKQPDLKIPR